MNVLFSNPPWHTQPSNNKIGLRGVRAGSRWPHTFEYYKHEPVDGLVPDLIAGYMPFPFWLATAGALAKRNGFNVETRDSIALGETYENFYKVAFDFKPDVVVVETATATFAHDLDIIAKLKQHNPSLIAIFTGLHVELEEPEFLAKTPLLDYMIYGEYEHPVLKLLEALRDKTPMSEVPSLVYRDDIGGVHKNEFGKLLPLDDLPWPEREGGIPTFNYFDGVCGLPKPQLQLIATRGCPYGCIFCIWPQMLYRGGSYRKRSPQDVVNEINENFKKHPYKSFYIDDDTFNISKKYVLELAKAIKDSGLNKYPWGTMGRADLIDDEQLMALKEAGLFSVKYGVESAEQQILDEADKRIDINRVIEGIIKTKKAGIKVHLTFTFGLPSDTVETIEKTIDLACRIPCDTAQFSIATPYPGTKMYTMYKENGWLTTDGWDSYVGSTTAVSRTKNFEPAQLEYYIKDAYKRFNESHIVRKMETDGLPERLKNHVAEGLNGNGNKSVLLFQCARVTLTTYLSKLLTEWGYDVHVMTHNRFVGDFEKTIPGDQIHVFDNSADFNYDALEGFAIKLKSQHTIGGIVLPFSNPTGDGYEEVERLAAHIAPVVAGVNLDGEIIR